MRQNFMTIATMPIRYTYARCDDLGDLTLRVGQTSLNGLCSLASVQCREFRTQPIPVGNMLQLRLFQFT